MGGKNQSKNQKNNLKMEENVKKVGSPKKPEITQENKKKPEPKSAEFKKKTADRREGIARVIRELGLWNLNKTKIAKEYGVDESTIRRDIKYLIKKIPKTEIIESRKEILEFAKKSMKDIRKQIFDSQGEEKRKAIDRGIAIAKTLTEAYEAYGMKEKAKEHHEIEGEIKFIEVTKSFKEIKDARKRDRAERKAKGNP